MIISDYRAHHFFPSSSDFLCDGKKHQVASTQYKFSTLSKGTKSFRFPDNHYPKRVEDIILENTKTRFVLNNRIVYDSTDTLASYKVVTKGALNTSTQQPGLYSTSGSIIHTFTKAYTLIVIGRYTGVIISISEYDTITTATESIRLINDLNALDSSKIMLLVGGINPKINRSISLVNTLYKFGANVQLSKDNTFKNNSAYVLCGVKDTQSIPPIELYSGVSDSDTKTIISTTLTLSSNLISTPGLWDNFSRKSSYSYNPESRIVYFHTPLTQQHKIHWLNSHVENWDIISPSQNQEFKSKQFIQGFNRPDFFIQPPTLNPLDEGFFGGYQCHLEIDTLPSSGMVFYGHDHRTFIYRSSAKTKSVLDGFQFRIYNSLGQESDPYCVIVRLANIFDGFEKIQIKDSLGARGLAFDDVNVIDSVYPSKNEDTINVDDVLSSNELKDQVDLSEEPQAFFSINLSDDISITSDL